MSLSGPDLRNIAFSKPPIGKRGYNSQAVDEFLTRAARELEKARVGQPCELTPSEVHSVAFKKPARGERGYNEDEVDALLDLLETELAEMHGKTAGQPPTSRPVSETANANPAQPSEGLPDPFLPRKSWWPFRNR